MTSIETSPLSISDLIRELHAVLAWLETREVQRIHILFGFNWGIHYYPQPHWEFEEVDITEVLERIRHVEERGLGAFGNDDFTIKSGTTEFLFCHEGDIHLSTDELEIRDHFHTRWSTAGVLSR